jgi:hypothetical protein
MTGEQRAHDVGIRCFDAAAHLPPQCTDAFARLPSH